METVRWRASGAYFPTAASKAGLVPETREALRLYGELGDVGAVREALVGGRLPQRSRQTRRTIAEFIQRRLFSWNPPAWALRDFVAAACNADSADLRTLLLLHAARQDKLLYDFVQCVILPGWQSGDLQLNRGDVQRFLDESAVAHPEVERWTHATREKLAGNLLSTTRDFGLLRGAVRKQIVEPVVSPIASRHLIRLLREEGILDEAIPAHPDWNIWLWTPGRVRAAMKDEAA